MEIGLRVDVDTYRGTSRGVPELCRIFDRHGIQASFFFSVGPDNMGRHLWRLFKPSFLWKMLRSNAAGLYGPEIIFMGTLWPGPQIGKRLGGVIKSAAEAGHEICFHAWDHHHEQAKVENISPGEKEAAIRKGVELLTETVGSPPAASAAPGWRCDDDTLIAKELFGFKYNSDCRGDSPFFPVVKEGKKLSTIQIPVTLPTYDEVIGRHGVTNDNYNKHMLSLLRPDGLNVLTIHAEAEGGKCAPMFEDFIVNATDMGYRFVPLGNIAAAAKDVSSERIARKSFPGREGWLACQESFEPRDS